MLQNVTFTPSRRSLEFGIYRDGDNNLDDIQGATLSQALAVSRNDERIDFTVEDTTSRHGGELHTDRYTIADGSVGHVRSGPADDMSDERTLASFVANTLDNAEANGAKQTWIDLVDHGGGDGGGLETGDGSVMSMPDIAKAIADGVTQHARAHPEDAGRNVDGVVANQCLMDTMGFADSLSHAGVRWLAASPETMLAPGVPSTVAHDIAAHQNDSVGMAKSIVRDVMQTKYFGAIRPAAAFDVIDCLPEKIRSAESAIKTLNDSLAQAASSSRATRATIRQDVGAIDGMVRFSASTPDMPWHSDRPAMAVYDTLSDDGRLSNALRSQARAAEDAVGRLVVAHRESDGFAPFDG
ncbi:MAG TPA: hypothetical protein VGF18_04425, partial [Candidatus Tumulicola sp.]